MSGGRELGEKERGRRLCAAIANVYLEAAGCEMRAMDRLLLRLWCEARLDPALAKLVARVLDAHGEGRMMGVECRAAIAGGSKVGLETLPTEILSQYGGDAVARRWAGAGGPAYTVFAAGQVDRWERSEGEWRRASSRPRAAADADDSSGPVHRAAGLAVGLDKFTAAAAAELEPHEVTPENLAAAMERADRYGNALRLLALRHCALPELLAVVHEALNGGDPWAEARA